MKLLYGHADEVLAWVGWRIPIIAKRLERDPTVSPFGPAYAIGVLDSQNRLVAGAVYHGWQPDFQTVEMSFAAETPRCLTRALIRDLLAYPYETLNANRINTATSKENRDARRFLERLGFRREGVATDGFGPGKDVICSRLLKREWLQTKWAPLAPRPAE